MQDHEFEKQVHQRMEEMSIPPSDAVWNGVEKRLHAGNKSRRWVIWFSFLFIALGISGYMMYNSSLLTIDTRISNERASRISNERVNTNSLKQNKITRGPIEIIQPSNNTPGSNQDLNEKTNPATTVSTAAGKPGQKSRQDSGPVADQALLEKSTPRKPHPLSPNTTKTQISNRMVSPVSSVRPTPQPDHSGEGDITPPEVMIKDSLGPAEPLPVLLPPVIRMNRDSLINTSEALDNPRRYAGNFINKTHTRRKLQWGLNIQGGRTGISKGGLSDLFTNTVVADVSNSFSQGNASANPGPAMIYIPPSALQPGPGVSAGVYVKRQLSERVSISAGLQYSRATTSHKVGNRIDSSLVLRQGNSLEQKDIEGYFKTGSSSRYINMYHFLSVPVTVQTRLTNSRSMPVFWDLGLSASRLMATNALHFDGNARIYYKDINLFNRTQINLQTGLPVGLVSKERFSVKAGPQLEYGITNLIKKERSAGKHLLFVGLKAYVDLF